MLTAVQLLAENNSRKPERQKRIELYKLILADITGNADEKLLEKHLASNGAKSGQEQQAPSSAPKPNQ